MTVQSARVATVYRIVLTGLALALVLLAFGTPEGVTAWSPTTRCVGLVVLAFICEYVDSSLGMGYGTILTPALALLGFSIETIVPAVLLSEALTGALAGVFHHRHGNVDWFKDYAARQTLVTLSICSVVGAVTAVLFAVSLPKEIVNLYIAVMITAIGVYLMVRARRPQSHSRAKIVTLGLAAAFNKGVSGGGYGPLMTGGQVLLGVPERVAVAITSLAESGVCVLGFGMYVALRGWPDWTLALPLCAGALLSVPLATWTVRILPENALRRAIGGGTLFLGALLLIKTLIPR